MLKDDIKRRIRKLKKLELKIRFSNENFVVKPHIRIIWHEFFNLNLSQFGKGKYSIDWLASLNKEEYKKVIHEFFFKVYEQYYTENALKQVFVKDTDKLAQLGLH